MYSEFFGLKAEPFGISPDPRFFFSSAQHVEASASLYYTIAQRRGFAVLIAAPGLGKTSVLVNLAERIRGEAQVAFFVHPQFERDAVLESVLLAMGLDAAKDPVERLRQLHAFLLDLFRQGKTCVVIIDEAQHLSPAALETIRMLSNFEAPAQKLIQFILAGQPALADLLRAPECEQILQRVNAIARLKPLDVQEIERYVAHRIAIAGGTRKLFSSAAMRLLGEHSGGVPRNINTLCFNALTLAYAETKKVADAECVRQVIADRSLESAAMANSASDERQEREQHELPFRTSPHRASLRAVLTAALTLITLIGAGLVLGSK